MLSGKPPTDEKYVFVRGVLFHSIFPQFLPHGVVGGVKKGYKKRKRKQKVSEVTIDQKSLFVCFFNQKASTSCT